MRWYSPPIVRNPWSIKRPGALRRRGGCASRNPLSPFPPTAVPSRTVRRNFADERARKSGRRIRGRVTNRTRVELRKTSRARARARSLAMRNSTSNLLNKVSSPSRARPALNYSDVGGTLCRERDSSGYKHTPREKNPSGSRPSQRYIRSFLQRSSFRSSGSERVLLPVSARSEILLVTAWTFSSRCRGIAETHTQFCRRLRYHRARHASCKEVNEDVNRGGNISLLPPQGWLAGRPAVGASRLYFPENNKVVATEVYSAVNDESSGRRRTRRCARRQVAGYDLKINNNRGSG